MISLCQALKILLMSYYHFLFTQAEFDTLLEGHVQERHVERFTILVKKAKGKEIATR